VSRRKRPTPPERLRRLRLAQDPPLSAAAFAARVGMDPMRYWRLENGKVRPLAEDFEAIAAALKISVAEIYDEDKAA
jgi:transcriptional regulator with XRE-family HTH domain